MKLFLLLLLLSADDQDVPGRPVHDCDAREFYRDDQVIDFDRQVYFEGRGLPAEDLARLAEALLRTRTSLEEMGFAIEFPWAIRTYHAEDYGDPINSYSMATTVTFRVPCPRFLLDGGLEPYDPVSDLFDRLVDLHWTLAMRPVDGFPLPAREAVNRFLSRRVLERLGEPSEWWPGKARIQPGSLRNLPPDHPLVQDRDRLLELLELRAAQLGSQRLLAQGGTPTPENEALVRELGLQAVLDVMAEWRPMRLTGSQTWPRFAQFLKPAAPGEPILPPVVWDVRVPFGEESSPEQRLKGLKARPEKSTSVRFQYGEQPELATHFVSVKEGAPTTWYEMPPEGMYRLAEVELQARRKGTFTDETFDVVALDGNFREVSRWTYPISVFEDTRTTPHWLVFSFESLPFLPQGFFVALDFPELRDDQDVELAVRWGDVGDHAFLSEPGRSIRSLENSGAWAMTIQVNVRSVDNQGKLEQLLLDAMKRANGR